MVRSRAHRPYRSKSPGPAPARHAARASSSHRGSPRPPNADPRSRASWVRQSAARRERGEAACRAVHLARSSRRIRRRYLRRYRRTAREAVGYAGHHTHPTAPAAAAADARRIPVPTRSSRFRPRPSRAPAARDRRRPPPTRPRAPQEPPALQQAPGAGRNNQVPNRVAHEHIVHPRDLPVKPPQDGYPPPPNMGAPPDAG